MERFTSFVREQRAALLGVLSHVDGDGWARPTVCTGWSVKDVCAHLVENELLLGRVYRGELSDLTDDSQAGVDRWVKVDGETVRYSLWHHGEATQRVIDSRSDESWRRPVTQDGATFELRHALRIHFFELAVHGHDVTDALDAQNVWGERAWVVAEACLRNAPGALASEPGPGTIAVRVEGVRPRALMGTASAWTLTDDEPADPTATWVTDPETLVLATTGRLPVADALARSTVGGDAVLLERIVGAWQVVG